MSYGSINKIRFYADWVNWLLNKGKMSLTSGTWSNSDIRITGLSMATGSNVYDMFDLHPANVQTITVVGSTQCTIEVDTQITGGAVQETAFIAILGHNLKQADAKFLIEADDDTSFASVQQPALTEVVNIGGDVTSGNYATPANNGWSLFTFNLGSSNNRAIRIVIDSATSNYDTDIKIGSIMIGKYIDAPHRPDTGHSRESIIKNKEMETTGGQKYSVQDYSSGANWVLAPYDISTNTSPNAIRRSGRTLYDLVFTYLTDAQFMPDNWDHTDIYQDDTIMNLLEYTQNSHFPCLLQWDSTSADEEESDFLFCRLYPGKATQTSPSNWQIPIKIQEEF